MMDDVSPAPPRTPTRTHTGARPGSSALPGFGRWAARSDVEQVRLYTKASLHSVAWFLLAMGTLAAAARLGETGPALVAVAAALVLGLAVTRALRPALDRTGRSLELREGRAELAVCVATGLALTAWASTLDGESGQGLALVVLGAGACGWICGAYADRRVLWAATAGAGLATVVATGNPLLVFYGAGLALFFGFTVTSSLWLLNVVSELDRARSAHASLAVAEERLRFSRDVHDVLGRHLSTIAVQAELAATLTRRQDPRAAEKTLEVRAAAHEALREARELSRGYRPLDLGQELAGAVSLLESAGITASADLEGLPEPWHEPVARVVREAVTNVLRHSDASRVQIDYDDDTVLVADDGSPRPDPAGDGTGLRRLAEELEPLGARLDAGPGEVGFEVRVRIGGAAPGEDLS